jgi:hypothetical protein
MTSAVDDGCQNRLQQSGHASFFVTSCDELLLVRVVKAPMSPLGATESEVPLDAWESAVRTAPALTTLADDVEAFLDRPDGPVSAHAVM